MTDVAAPPAFQSLAEIAPRRKTVDVEHSIQKHAKLFARDAIDVPHLFLAFDRSKKAGQWSHMKQKARGLVAGTPDTLTLVLEVDGIWCEFKQPGQKPSDTQLAVGKAITDLGGVWCWATSVTEYYGHLKDNGVPLRPNAAILAMHHDARVEGEIGRAREKVAAASPAKRSAASRKGAATRSQIKQHAARISRARLGL